MIGIVIVSHSKKLAEGVCELAQQMVQDRVPIATAGGTDNPDEPIGTDPMFVMEAIESVYSEDGVLVLMDLGSALMSAEAAVEFLDEEQQADIYLCEAPLVEGVMAAAVQAMTGSSIERVYAEAQAALTAKREQLEPVLRFGPSDETAVHPPTAETAPSADEPVQSSTITIPNALGLHARPAAKLVALVSDFDAKVALEVESSGRSANASSINQVAILGARQGDRVQVTAQGPDAAQVLAAIKSLVADNLGDPLNMTEPVSTAQTPPPTNMTPSGQLQGIAVCAGIAIGPVFVYQPYAQSPAIESQHIEDSIREQSRLDAAIEVTQVELSQLKAALSHNIADAAIFDAHILMLQDKEFVNTAKTLIEAQHLNAEAAWQQIYQALAAQYRALEDSYLRERGDDVVDVGERVLRQLLDVKPADLNLSEPAILVIEELTPSLAAQLSQSDNILGIVTEQGGATGHGAILARSAGIPTVMGVHGAIGILSSAQQVALDGGQGIVWVDPDEPTQTTLAATRTAWLTAQAEANRAKHELCYTSDGRRIEVLANIARVEDVYAALDNGAEGVGLFRTEFLFMDRDNAPSEEEQYHAYKTVAKALGNRPLTIRTLDVGGDKPIPYLPFGHEENPFLGWRGIRFCLDTPEIFRPQLRAILRATMHGNIKIMFPMISTLDELSAARAIISNVYTELTNEGVSVDVNTDVGMMVEVPSVAASPRPFMDLVDFMSVGTNDLTQYMFAADRGNPTVSGLVNARHPAILRVLDLLTEIAQDRRYNGTKQISICGELAGDIDMTPVLVSLGVESLSMNARTIPLVKQQIRQLDMNDVRVIGMKASTFKTLAEVNRLLNDVKNGTLWG
ncbi:MAG: phosphoenolpyruvate--protein phosphotransferase [Chloroflexota bacterium]